MSRRAPTLADSARNAGTISWEEHVEAFADYDRRFPGTTAERLAERGGFSYSELLQHLGHEPRSWRPR